MQFNFEERQKISNVSIDTTMKHRSHAYNNLFFWYFKFIDFIAI